IQSFFFFQAEDGIRDKLVTGVQTCALPISPNMLAISGYIRTGEMDFILLSPVSSRFLVSTRTVALPALADVLAGLILIVYAGDKIGRASCRERGWCWVGMVRSEKEAMNESW